MKRDLKNIEQKASCMRPYYLFKKKKKVPQGLRSKMECLNKLVELSIKKTEACEVCIDIYIFFFSKKKRWELSVGQQEQVIGLVNVELYQSNSSFSTLGFERIEWVNQPNKLKWIFYFISCKQAIDLAAD